MRTFKMLLVTLAAVSLAGVASAQQLTLQMTGEWFSNRGPLVDIPLNGGPVLQPFPCELQTGCFANFVPANGGIPVLGGTANVDVAPNLTTLTVGAAAAAPATINLAPGIFGQNTNFTQTQTALVTIVPTVVQLQTNFRVFAPATEEGQLQNGTATATITGMGGTLMSTAPDRILRADAWTNQTGRLAPAFDFCPGPVAGSGALGTLVKVGFVTNCTNSNASTGPGAYNGIVSYAGNGANNFGGTMSILLDGGGFVSVIIGQAGGGTPLLGHQPIGTPGATGQLREQVEGGGYAFLNSAYLQSGPINLGFMTNLTLNKITTVGPTLSAMLPQDRNLNWGFPHTTGRVSVMNVETNQGQPGTTTLVATGIDNRDAFGRGNITLVSGGTSYRQQAQMSFGALNFVNMTFTPEPQSSVMLGASLLAIGGLFVAVRRSSRKD